ncbi:MAG: Mur ligase family protein [Candidatus Gracilibacteria bacterium]
MKRILKTAVQKFLEKLVAIKLKRIKPTVIGVTGSFGKTSTKEAIYEVLKSRWNVYRNPKSLNTEIGLLLAILEQPSGFSSPFKWAKILAKSVLNARFGKKYDFMVLEYGADKPGDIKHLAKLVKPNISVITKISRVHQAEGQFKSEEEVFEEKKQLAECLDKDGIAILNAEDDFLQKLHGKLLAKTFWFSSSSKIKADIGVSDAKNTPTGFSATIRGRKKHYWAI